MENTPKIYRKAQAKELKWWQSLLQMYWLMPKKSRLESFVIDGEMITIAVQDGTTISAPITSISAKCNKDKYDRRFCTVKSGGMKLSFCEIPWRFSEKEWDDLFAILEAIDANNRKGVNVDKVLGILQGIIDGAKNFV